MKICKRCGCERTGAKQHSCVASLTALVKVQQERVYHLNVAVADGGKAIRVGERRIEELILERQLMLVAGVLASVVGFLLGVYL